LVYICKHSHSDFCGIHDVALENCFRDNNFGEESAVEGENNCWPNIDNGNYSTWDKNPLFPH